MSMAQLKVSSEKQKDPFTSFKSEKVAENYQKILDDFDNY